MDRQGDDWEKAMSPPLPPPTQYPYLPWRIMSSAIMGVTGMLSRGFLYGLNSVEVTGLEKFLALLESRRDPRKRQRGLITVSNHVSVLDDPLIWGLLPLRHAFTPSTHRFSLGAHDICFLNPLLTTFFTSGQVLPAHRLKHSPHGGPFQPSISEAIRLLSSPTQPPSTATTSHPLLGPRLDYPPLTLAPSSFSCNRHAWLHVFPEGLVHQHSRADLRYFKWGVARLILESEPAPDVLPIFIDGTQRLMPEHRTFPRFLPRVGQKVRVAFGEVVDFEERFGELRRRWQGLVARGGEGEGYRDGEEAREIRREVARRVRGEVLKVRAGMGGFGEPEEGLGDAEAWRGDREGKGRRYRSEVDGSDINQD